MPGAYKIASFSAHFAMPERRLVGATHAWPVAGRVPGPLEFLFRATSVWGRRSPYVRQRDPGLQFTWR
jgi:hypothetical protein